MNKTDVVVRLATNHADRLCGVRSNLGNIGEWDKAFNSFIEGFESNFSQIFPLNDIQKRIEDLGYKEHYISVDWADVENPSYCLWAKQKGSTYIFLTRKTTKQEFDEEIKNLSKYFNAKIL